MNRFYPLFLILFIFRSLSSLSAQNCGNMNIQLKADIPFACSTMAMTMLHDQLDRQYLYVANKEGGLKVYDISDPANPTLVSTMPVSTFGLLHVMNISQEGAYLYLALGNSFTGAQSAGMAIVDVSTASSPTLKDYYVVQSSSSGGGIVKVEGNYAYFGAMGNGLVIFDISDKSNIKFMSQFKPDINYPVKNPNANLYNARGMEVRNGIVYLCYDAGGFRIINCSDKSNPVETGRYANPALYKPLNLPRAYNNLVLDDSVVYVAVDYCGMEVLDIRDTANIKLIGWWNPDHCPGNNWFTSDVHANEVQYDRNEHIVMLSTGKSDMVVVNVSNPAAPDSCNIYGGVTNNIGTWGVGLYKNQIYLSYICTAGIPFSSNWTGIKILTYDRTSGLEQMVYPTFTVYPVPANNMVKASFSAENENRVLRIFASNGQLVETLNIEAGYSGIDIATNNLVPGMYFMTIDGGSSVLQTKFAVQH